MYEEDDYRCQNCHRRGGKGGNTELHAHHIVPLKDGGSNNRSNLTTLCKDCHRAIHSDAQAPTVESAPATVRDLSAVIALGSVFLAGKHPTKLTGVVVFITLLFLLAGQRLIPVLFLLSSLTFIGIMNYAKSKGDGGTVD